MNERLFAGRSFDAFLFDVDGTLLSSIEVAERVWTRWAAKFGIDAATFLPHLHGRRAVDSIRHLNIPGIDAEREAVEITLAEIEDVKGVHPIAGVQSFLESLPASRWAIVTSAPRALALRRLEAAGLKAPAVIVTAEDITNGKPDPSCYLAAASQLGFDAKNCLVFEDAAAGIRAGEAAGAQVLVITALHDGLMQTEHPTRVDFTRLRAKVTADGRLELTSI
ncbi:MAG: HAD-IA family hydrolase [Povalibacter sp.]